MERGHHAAEAAKFIPDTQDADIHTADDVTKVRNFSADKGVAQCAEVGGVAHFLGEDDAGVDVPRDVADVDLLGLNAVANSAVFEVDVTHTLGARALRPIDRPLVVVVQTCGADGVREVHFVAAVSEGEYLS